MSQPFRQFLRLSSEQKRFVSRAIFILPMTYAGLELLGFQRLLSCIQHFTRVDQKRGVLDELSSYPQILSAMARRCPLPMKCLGRSVALCWLLRLEGIDATVHIGVRKNQYDLDAHAWVQCGDLIINDTEDVADRFVRMVPSLPAMYGTAETRPRTSSSAQH